MDINLGYQAGETCGRNGCVGIIDAYEKEGNCSCHINPPCCHCTDSVEYCDTCNWDGKEEQDQYIAKSASKYVPFKIRTIADLDNTKIDYIISGHTHFTQKVDGVYPEGATRNEVEKKVRGSFGGRFERFGNGHFTYIAQTD